MRSGAAVVYALDGTLGSLIGSAGVGTMPTADAMAEGIIQAWSRSEELALEGRSAFEDLTWAAVATRVMGILSTVVSNTRAGDPDKTAACVIAQRAWE
jgi:hypothetical protein